MKKSPSLKEVVIFTSGPELDYGNTNKEYKALNNFISEGNSTLLRLDAKYQKLNHFGSFLGFDSLLSAIKNDHQPKHDNLVVHETKKVQASKQDDEDETFEIKYPKNPEKFSELASFNMIVATNSNETAKLCHQAEINYYLTSDFDKEKILGAISSLNWDVILLDFNYNVNDDTDKVLEAVEKLVEDFEGLAPYFRCIIPMQKDMSNKAIQRIEVNESLLGLIPKQTWQFSQGEVKYDTNLESHISIMINHKKNRNRKDKINSLSDYSNPSLYKNFGGSMVYGSAIIREISFELEKLPKFGA